MDKQIANEKMILSACLYDYKTLEHTLMCLDFINFFYPPHQSIFSCMKDLAFKKVTVNKNTLMSELRAKNENEAIQALMNFYNEYLDIDFLDDKIEEIKLFSLRREMIEKCAQGMKFFEDRKKKRSDFIQWVDEISKHVMVQEKKISVTVEEILTNFEENPTRSFLQIAQERQEKALQGTKIDLGYPTHYQDIDRVYGGFKEGHLTIIGARPGIGKTTFALNLALKQLFESNIPVGFFSLEMEAREIVEKLALSLANIEHESFRTGKITGDQFQFLYKSTKELQTKKLVIDDTGRLNLSLMESKAKYWQRMYGIKILFIDYLQLISSTSKYSSKYEEVTAISQRLKIIAKELKLPVICLAQLNREAAKSSEGPKVHDLRDSGSIEQDADEIFLLHSPSSGPSPADQYNKPGILEVNLAKNRFGDTGRFELAFIKKTGKIENLSKKEPDDWFRKY